MPRFTFHLLDDTIRFGEPTIRSLPDDEAAWYQAFRDARERIGTAGATSRPERVDVEDETGTLVVSLHLGEVARLVG